MIPQDLSDQWTCKIGAEYVIGNHSSGSHRSSGSSSGDKKPDGNGASDGAILVVLIGLVLALGVIAEIVFDGTAKTMLIFTAIVVGIVGLCTLVHLSTRPPTSG